MAEYIKREDVLELAKRGFIVGNSNYSSVVSFINDVPSADVVERDEGIRMGAELAAMHGSDATSQDLEKAFWTGYEEAMKKRDVRPVVHGKWEEEDSASNRWAFRCSVCKSGPVGFKFRFCPNCGADMRGDDDV